MTGGAKGIGEAIVRALVAENAVPIIVDLDEAVGRRLQEELTAAGYRCELVLADLAEEGACRRAMEEATAAGPLHALVNNAGVNDGVSLREGTPEEFVG